MVHCHCTLSMYTVTLHCPCALSVLFNVYCHCTWYTVFWHCTLSLHTAQ